MEEPITGKVYRPERISERDYIRYAVDNMRRTTGYPDNNIPATSGRGIRSSFEIACYTKAIQDLYKKREDQFFNGRKVRKLIIETARTINAGQDLLRTDQAPEKSWGLPPDKVSQALDCFAAELLPRLDKQTYDPVETVALIHYRLHRTGNFFKDGDHRISEALGAFVLMRHNMELPDYTELTRLRQARPTTHPTTYNISEDLQFTHWVEAFQLQFRKPQHIQAKKSVMPSDMWHVKEDYFTCYESTVYDPKNVMRSREEIDLLRSVTGKATQDIVVYLPRRMALHETIVAAVTRIKMKDQTDFLIDLILNENGLFNQNILPSLLAENLEVQFKEDRKILESYVEYIIDDHFYVVNPNMEIRHIIDKYSQIIINRIKSGGYNPRLVESRTVLHSLVTDELLCQRYCKLIRTIVDKWINSYLAERPNEALPLKPNHKRAAWVVVGGPAAGKSDLERSFIMREHEFLGNHSPLCLVNPDLYKVILLPKHSEDTNHGGKTRSEGLYIRELIRNRLAEMIESDNAPDFLITHQSPTKERMRLPGMGGAKVNLFVVTCPIDRENGALMRSYNRALDKDNHDAYNRFLATESVLLGHRAASAELPGVLAEGEYDLRLFDTKSRPGALIAIMENHDRKLRVFDPSAFIEFTKKTFLNPNATSPSELYQLGLTCRDIAKHICAYPEAGVSLDFRYSGKLPNPIHAYYNPDDSEEAVNTYKWIVDAQPETYMLVGHNCAFVRDFSTFIKAVGMQMAEALLIEFGSRWPLTVHHYNGSVLLMTNDKWRVVLPHSDEEIERLTQESEEVSLLHNVKITLNSLFDDRIHDP